MNDTLTPQVREKLAQVKTALNALPDEAVLELIRDAESLLINRKEARQAAAIIEMHRIAKENDLVITTKKKPVRKRHRPVSKSKAGE